MHLRSEFGLQEVKKGGNFNTRKFFNYPESFLDCLYLAEPLGHCG